MFVISLKNNKSFSCDKDTTILKAAKNAGIILEHSCLVARCRSCVVKVLDGEVIDVQEELVLSEDEKRQGYILSCNAKPRTNIKLDIEDLGEITLNESRTFPAKIDSIEKITNTIIKVVLRLPPTSNFNFEAGQYVNIIKGDIIRSYSIANAVRIDSKIEFYIKKYEHGKMSNYWFQEAKVDNLLRIEGPQGTFFYRKNECKNIVFLATGTGMAPVKAILEHLNKNSDVCKDKNIWLVCGGRHKEDIFWKPEFENLNLTYIPVLSRSEIEWNGAKGYVQEFVLKEKIDLVNTQVYACGSTNMIASAKELFLQNGMKYNQFYSDAFVSSN